MSSEVFFRFTDNFRAMCCCELFLKDRGRCAGLSQPMILFWEFYEVFLQCFLWNICSMLHASRESFFLTDPEKFQKKKNKIKKKEFPYRTRKATNQPDEQITSLL